MKVSGRVWTNLRMACVLREPPAGGYAEIIGLINDPSLFAVTASDGDASAMFTITREELLALAAWAQAQPEYKPGEGYVP